LDASTLWADSEGAYFLRLGVCRALAVVVDFSQSYRCRLFRGLSV